MFGMNRYFRALQFAMFVMEWWDKSNDDGKIDANEMKTFLAYALQTFHVNEAAQVQRITNAAVEIAEALGLTVEVGVT